LEINERIGREKRDSRELRDLVVVKLGRFLLSDTRNGMEGKMYRGGIFQR